MGPIALLVDKAKHAGAFSGHRKPCPLQVTVRGVKDFDNDGDVAFGVSIGPCRSDDVAMAFSTSGVVPVVELINIDYQYILPFRTM